MFTKKHYEAIAKVVEEVTSFQGSISSNDLIDKLEELFHQDNPGFDGVKFYLACKGKGKEFKEAR